jgi:flagellar biosynthesis/type III secretory pathway chaperone
VPQNSEFAASLREENTALRAFRTLLETERACLKRSDVEALLELTRTKSEQLDQLAEFSERRSRYLVSKGLELSQAGMAKAAQTPELAELWDALLSLASEVRNLNDANGALIAIRMNHNHAALAALQVGGRVPKLYGPDGQRDVGDSTRTLGRA